MEVKPTEVGKDHMKQLYRLQTQNKVKTNILFTNEVVEDNMIMKYDTLESCQLHKRILEENKFPYPLEILPEDDYERASRSMLTRFVSDIRDSAMLKEKLTVEEIVNRARLLCEKLGIHSI